MLVQFSIIFFYFDGSSIVCLFILYLDSILLVRFNKTVDMLIFQYERSGWIYCREVILVLRHHISSFPTDNNVDHWPLFASSTYFAFHAYEWKVWNNVITTIADSLRSKCCVLMITITVLNMQTLFNKQIFLLCISLLSLSKCFLSNTTLQLD